MSSIVYRHPDDLRVNAQPTGWARIYWPGDEIGVALDPMVSSVWSAAQNCTEPEVAGSVGISGYLASATLAVLARAGLLRSEPASPEPLPSSSLSPGGKISVAAVILHRCPQADLRDSTESILEQAYPALDEIVILAEAPTSYHDDRVTVVRSGTGETTASLGERLSELTTEAILLLDSQVSLASGGLEELVYALGLRRDIAAVAPRIMWRRWPGFVAELGDWRSTEGAPFSPYAGHLDVGQFGRWQEVPAISRGAGLISCEALEEIKYPQGEFSMKELDKWCQQARLMGSHIVAATQALGYGPWAGASGSSKEVAERGPGFWRRAVKPDLATSIPEIQARFAHWPAQLPVPGADAVLRDGRPALTTDGIRGFYSHYPSVAPLPVRRRVVFAGRETSRHRGMAEQLSAGCEVDWVSVSQAEDDRLLSVCQGADLIIATAKHFAWSKSLLQAEPPVLVDVQPPVTMVDRIGEADDKSLWMQVKAFADRSWDWLDAVDGVVCASEEERLYWLGALAARDRLSPYNRVDAHRDWRNLVMVVPSGVDSISRPAKSVLKGVHPDIDAEDEVIIWCGPLQSSDDPTTAVSAFDALRSSRSNVRLLFAAFEGQEPHQETLQSAMQLVKDLDLTERVLFEQQIPGHLRDGYLSEADLAVALTEQTLEGQLGKPEALPACIGAGLPIVIVDGHAGSDLIRRYGIGQTVPSHDIEAVVDAFGACLDRPHDAYTAGFAKARHALAWSQAIIPLADFCRRPRYATDRLVEKLLFHESTLSSDAPTPLWVLPRKAWRSHQQQGLLSTMREIRQYIRWKLGV